MECGLGQKNKFTPWNEVLGVKSARSHTMKVKKKVKLKLSLGQVFTLATLSDCKR